MKKFKICSSWISKDGIIFIHDPIHKANIWVLIVNNYEEFREKINKHINNIDGLLSDLALAGKTDGGHIQKDIKDGEIEIIWSKNNLETLCHEVHHAVFSILSDRKIDQNEPGAYLFEFIIKEILRYKFRDIFKKGSDS